MHVACPQITTYQSTYSQIRILSDLELFFLADVVNHLNRKIVAEKGFSLRDTQALALMFGHLCFEDSLNAGFFRVYVSGSGKKRCDLLRSPFDRFFFREGKRYKLTEEGQSLRSYWLTTLRRMTQDFEAFHFLRFGYYTEEQRAKRRGLKPFYNLPENEQIAIMRDYYAIPYQTGKEHEVIRKVRVDLCYKYGLTRWDRVNAIKKYGDAVKSVRNLPEHKDKFPRDNPPASPLSTGSLPSDLDT